MPVGDEEEAEGLITERRLSDGRAAQFAALMSSIRCGRASGRNGRTAGGLREARFFPSGALGPDGWLASAGSALVEIMLGARKNT